MTIHDTNGDSRWGRLMLLLVVLSWLAVCAIAYGLYRLIVWVQLPRSPPSQNSRSSAERHGGTAIASAALVAAH